MSEIAAVSLVAQIHAAPLRMVLAVTGGGSRAIADLLEVPGGSQTLLEAVVPYSAAALRDWLGAPPEHYCSAQTARAMAVAAFLRAKTLTAADQSADADLAGIACTASLASDRPKRGPHRIHVAWQRISAIATHSIELVKGRRSRAAEEELAARLILDAVAEAAGIADRVPLGNSADEPLVVQRTEAPAAWQELLRGTIEAVRHEAGSIETAARHESLVKRTRRVIFSGAFNPLHDGHRRMAEVAAAILGQPVEFEISIENVDKPPLDITDMQQRLAQFATGQTLWFTRAPAFERKAALFPDTTFVVGADTIRRIADPHYYGDDPQAAAAAIEALGRQKSRFLVFGRLCGDRFESLNQLELPESLQRLCREVSAEQFREDISSTRLRHSHEE
jgi:nicotinic acid mononucleotide adenylyltransferase/nicotinamide mononucleotide (NMN) deamidase PncC